MDNNEAAVAGCAIIMGPVVLFVIFLFRALERKRQASPQDLAQQQALMAAAERMERRIDSLESLLDSELPGWRSRSTNP